MTLALVLVLAASAANAAPAHVDDERGGISAMLDEEAPDVFLAKATLQQYLSRVVRKDWDGAKRLTHPKALNAVAQAKWRSGAERHALAPWAAKDVQLKQFRFERAKELAPGIVAIETSEDSAQAGRRDLAEGEPAVYLLFKSRGGFLVGDKKAGMELAELRPEGLRSGYPGYVDAQAQAQARRESAIHNGRHR
jgi:hypothetical protein